MIKNDNKNYQKTTCKYECKLCHYSCSDISNFKKHLQTKKHQSLHMVTNDNKNYQSETLRNKRKLTKRGYVNGQYINIEAVCLDIKVVVF